MRIADILNWMRREGFRQNVAERAPWIKGMPAENKPEILLLRRHFGQGPVKSYGLAGEDLKGRGNYLLRGFAE